MITRKKKEYSPSGWRLLVEAADSYGSECISASSMPTMGDCRNTLGTKSNHKVFSAALYHLLRAIANCSIYGPACIKTQQEHVEWMHILYLLNKIHHRFLRTISSNGSAFSNNPIQTNNPMRPFNWSAMSGGHIAADHAIVQWCTNELEWMPRPLVVRLYSSDYLKSVLNPSPLYGLENVDNCYDPEN